MDSRKSFLILSISESSECFWLAKLPSCLATNGHGICDLTALQAVFVPATRFKFCWITGRHSSQSHRSGHLALLSPIPLSPIRFQAFHSEWTRYGVSVVKRGASYRTRGRGGFPNTKLSPHWQVVRNLQGLFTA